MRRRLDRAMAKAAAARYTGRRIMTAAPPFLADRTPVLLALGSAGLLLGALAFQYIGKLEPCPLCHWQRYPHIAVVAFGLAALAVGGTLRRVCLGLAVLGLLASAGIAFFHAGVEWKWWEGLQECAVRPRLAPIDPAKLANPGPPPPRCDEAPWSMLGISMAGWNGLISLALAGLGAWSLTRRVRA
jgi:disulfide bond formation protein DsbB